MSLMRKARLSMCRYLCEEASPLDHEDDKGSRSVDRMPFHIYLPSLVGSWTF